MMDAPVSPENAVPTEDVGADTGGRFAYQHTWTATLACALFGQPPPFTDVWCEHLEDILLKQADGKFQAHQIKTRETGELWRAGDDTIVGALARFADLESDFPGCFSKYVLATNYNFFSKPVHGSNLRWILQQAVSWAKTGGEKSRPLKLIVGKVVKKSGKAEDVVVAAMAKTECDDSLPKIGDCTIGLCEALAAAHIAAGAATRAALKQAAQELTDEIRRAASHSHRDALPAWLRALPDADNTEAQACRMAKHFTLERLYQVVNAALGPTALLQPGGKTADYSPTEGRSILAQKLEAGGLSATTVNMAADFASSALTRFIEWQSIFGDDQAVARYKHVKTLVLKDCADAHETAKNGTACFGDKMQAELRGKLRQRIANGPAAVFDCREEHLEGVAYELTKECKVWWSNRFTLRA